MATRIFICWSGDQSHNIARAIQRLLATVYPSLTTDDAVFVSDNLEKGVTWFGSILTALNKAEVGIAVVTAENLASPWMHFEAGALASKLASDPPTTDQMTATEFALSQLHARVEGTIEPQQPQTASSIESVVDLSVRPTARHRLFTVLHGVTAASVTGPLSAYQATSTAEPDMRELARTIARLLNLTDAPTDRKKIVEGAWSRFAAEVKHATVPIHKLIGDLESLFQRKTFKEPVNHCSDQAWLARFEGAHVTRERLFTYADQVKAVCSLHEQGLFDMLLAELDGYAMAIQSLLLTPWRFPIDSRGELEMPPGIQRCCEDRRMGIRSLAGRLMHPLDAPLTDTAVLFMGAETHEERKMIVHRLEGEIRRARETAYDKLSKGGDRRDVLHSAISSLVPTLVQPASDEPVETSDPQPIRLTQLRASSWDLDRIRYYLLVCYFDTNALRWEERPHRSQTHPVHASAARADEKGPPVSTLESLPPLEHDLFCAARDVEVEVERYRAKAKGGSSMPLTYALAALQALDPRSAHFSEKVQRAVTAALALVRDELGREPDEILETDTWRPIVRLLNDLEGAQPPTNMQT